MAKSCSFMFLTKAAILKNYIFESKFDLWMTPVMLMRSKLTNGLVRYLIYSKGPQRIL